MRKILLLAIAIVFMLTSSIYAAPSYGTVKDDNDGKEGQIFVNSGADSGGADIGTWVDPKTMPELQGPKGDKGDTGAQGIQGAKGDKGDKGDQGERGKGLKDQYKAGVELRVVDTKHTTWSVYYNRDFNNSVNEVGVKVTIKLGKSYLERQIEDLQRQLNALR